MDQGNYPLVSVIVITYNSSEFVLETLESIREQTYQNIELIISDDCSTDNTVDLCKRWIFYNRERFFRVELVEVETNTGIPANCNRGLYRAKGEWIKIIAGDDKLLKTAFSDIINFASDYKNIEVVDSIVDIYNSDFSKKVGEFNFGKTDFHRKSIASYEQRKLFADSLFGVRIISTLGVFIKRELIIEIGGFEEKYRLLEDSPLWWKVLKANRKFYFIDKATTCYRRHEEAVSFNKKVNYKESIVSNFQLTVLNFIKDQLFRETTKINKINFVWILYSTKLVLLLGNKGMLAKLVHKVSLVLQPLRIFSNMRGLRTSN